MTCPDCGNKTLELFTWTNLDNERVGIYRCMWGGCGWWEPMVIDDEL